MCRLSSSSHIPRAALSPRLKGLLASYDTKGKTARKRLVIHTLFVFVRSRHSPGPGNQEDQGRRASKEGKVVVTRRRWTLHFLAHLFTHRPLAYVATVAKLYIWRLSLYPLHSWIVCTCKRPEVLFISVSGLSVLQHLLDMRGII